MNKAIKELIEKKANNIIRQYYPKKSDPILDNKAICFDQIKTILEKTLMTPKRINRLHKKYKQSIPVNDIFTSDSNIFFSPNFEEALKYDSLSGALMSFEELYLESPDDFCKKPDELYQITDDLFFEENIYHLRLNGIIPFFTIQELASVFKNFAIFFEDNKKSLIKTGWPKIRFTSSPWLFYTLASNYPIEIPAYIKNFNKVKNPCEDPYFFIKKLFYDKSNEYTEFKDEKYSLEEFFTYEELDFMEAIRPNIFNLKKIILKEINENIFSNTSDKDMCFRKCIYTIYDYISKCNIDNLLHINEKYNQFKFYTYNINGTFNSVLEILVYAYQESKFEKNSHFKIGYNLLLKEFSPDYKDKIESYYQIHAPMNTDDNVYWRYIEKQGKLKTKNLEILKKKMINDKFISNVLKTEKESHLKSNSLLKPKYPPYVKNLIKLFDQMKKNNIKSDFLSELPTSSRKRITPLELPPGTKWEQIILKFIDNESIEIKGPDNYKEVATFREMEFENRKKSGRPPNKLWVFLQALAHKKGTFSWDLLKKGTRNPNIKDAMDNATKRKQLVNQKLKAFFNLKEDPIIYDRKNKIYQTKFEITSENELF